MDKGEEEEERRRQEMGIRTKMEFIAAFIIVVQCTVLYSTLYPKKPGGNRPRKRK